MVAKKVGRRIVELRKEQGISQRKFALMIGLNRSYLSGIENGNRNPSINTLEKSLMD